MEHCFRPLSHGHHLPSGAPFLHGMSRPSRWSVPLSDDCTRMGDEPLP